MIYTHRSRPKRNLSDWHRWYAWHPVTFHSQGRKVTVWLSHVARRRTHSGYYDAPHVYEYRVLPFSHLID